MGGRFSPSAHAHCSVRSAPGVDETCSQRTMGFRGGWADEAGQRKKGGGERGDTEAEGLGSTDSSYGKGGGQQDIETVKEDEEGVMMMMLLLMI